MTESKHIDSLHRQIVEPLHQAFVSTKRADRLARSLQKLLPSDALSGLDIGCGTGEIGQLLSQLQPNLTVLGTDLYTRNNAVIKVIEFDGQTLPFPDKSFDFAMLIDVLHHTPEPSVILREAYRVSRQFVLVKDHLCRSNFDYFCLRFMDWVGNPSSDVGLPHHYLSEAQWQALYNSAALKEIEHLNTLHLYPAPFSWLFDRHLHFLAKLVAK